MNDTRRFLTIVICLFASLEATGINSAVAQEPTSATTATALEASAISTERPTAGSSPDLIPAGSLQMEYGVNLSFQRKQFVGDAPESLLRLGLFERLEIRFLSSNLVYQNSGDNSVSSSFETQDAAVSAKILLAGPGSIAPKSAIVCLSMPTGGKDQTSGSYDPGLTAIWTQVSPKGYFLNEVAQATLTTVDHARRPVWTPSVAGGRSLSERLSVFLEYAPAILPDHSTAYTVDGGFAWLPAKLKQLDVRTGYTRDEYGIHYLVSLGYSLRHDGLPNLHLR